MKVNRGSNQFSIHWNTIKNPPNIMFGGFFNAYKNRLGNQAAAASSTIHVYGQDLRLAFQTRRAAG